MQIHLMSVQGMPLVYTIGVQCISNTIGGFVDGFLAMRLVATLTESFVLLTVVALCVCSPFMDRVHVGFSREI